MLADGKTPIFSTVVVLEQRNILANAQCGFRKNRSTVDHLVTFDTVVRTAFKQRPRGCYLLRPGPYFTKWICTPCVHREARCQTMTYVLFSYTTGILCYNTLRTTGAHAHYAAFWLAALYFCFYNKATITIKYALFWAYIYSLWWMVN